MARTAKIADWLAHVAPHGAQVTPVSADASFRSYYRVQSGTSTAILMDAPPEKEDVEPYLRIARLLRDAGDSAPSVLAENLADGLLLLEDLGDGLFTRHLAAAPEHDFTLYEAAVEVLVRWHARPAPALPPYNHAALMREAALFAEWYIPVVAQAAEGLALAEEYLAIWEALLTAHPQPMTCFVHRDYHASNLLWLPEREGTARVGLLDFQDALLGAPAYDLVSLLEDARRDVSPTLQQAMLRYYLARTGADEATFSASYALLGAQRNLKILGIFVRLWKRDGKPDYLAFIPRVWDYLLQDLTHPHLAPLRTWMEAHMPAARRRLIQEAA